MNIEEEISERIIRQAFEGGGEVIFTDTELEECTDRNLLQKVDLQLSLYGAINEITTLGRWSIFKINEKGIRFIRQGGFKGEREREQRKDELERLTLDISRLQKESEGYKKKMRIWQTISAILTLASTILSSILALLV
ncbi:hypothetical protein DWZ36_17780 [Phocaeicola vulgatus]|jgi:hypothetical protein|uniref:hypothetical protein n=1 Tax=Phocaeicola vulgatus TaxID=821 RepID=UPI000E4E5264|nr:hypothetical protein [Phocaeicola vulgatus]RHM86817.1 hypothetical protein DWZ36_17780 [Phocaeicola vulgatus]